MPTAAGLRARGFSADGWWVQPLRYWHLLSLDAPTIAAVWLLTFYYGEGARQHVREAIALFLAVWLLYVADRLLDARGASGSLKARHHFHARHARKFVCVWVCVAPVAAVLLACLAAPVRSAWLWLSVPLLGYAVLVHKAGSRAVPKEWIVAAMFALATILPAAVGAQQPGRLWAEAALFAGICLLNGIAIAQWEHAEARGLPVWNALQFRAVCLGVGLVAVLAAPWLSRVPALACGLSAMLLCALGLVSEKLEAVTLRALVDAALLTPLLLVALLR